MLLGLPGGGPEGVDVAQRLQAPHSPDTRGQSVGTRVLPPPLAVSLMTRLEQKPKGRGEHVNTVLFRLRYSNLDTNGKGQSASCARTASTCLR